MAGGGLGEQEGLVPSNSKKVCDSRKTDFLSRHCDRENKHRDQRHKRNKM